MPDGDQLSLHYCAGKGDWKFKKEWLDERRSYLRAAKKEKVPMDRTWSVGGVWRDQMVPNRGWM